MAHIVIDGRIINSSTGRYVERLVEHLQDIDKTNQYTILVPAKDELFWIPRVSNFTIQIADFPNYSLSEQTGFKRLIEELQPDLVHFCMPQQPIFYKGNVVTTFHDLNLFRTYNSSMNWFVYRFKQFIGRFVFKRVSETSNQIIVPTKYVKNDIIHTLKTNPDKITVTYEAADVNPTLTREYEHPYKQFILFVGKQSGYKNLRTLAAAHQRLIKKYPDLGLILAGRLDGKAEINKALFAEKGYKNITFTGFIEDAQRDWLYTNTAAYVFPSLMEGFGLPGLEAMGYGAPVVSSNATCLPEVYGDAAHYFDPTDVSDMARAIDEVLASKTLREDLVKKGHKQVKKYSWHKTAKQTHEVYIKALKSLPEQL